jgi:hypothetical protein
MPSPLLKEKLNHWPWVICFLLMSVLLCLTTFQSDSHDSQFYHFLVEQMTQLGPSKFFFVEWKGHYGLEGLVQDHFMGHILLGYLCTFIGIPALHSLHILNIFFIMGSIYLLYHLSLSFRTQKESALLLIFLLFLPISFSYGLRGNHEASMTFFLLIFIYGQQRLSDHKGLGIIYMLVGAHGFLLVKGILVLLLIPIAFCSEFFIGNKKWTRFALLCLLVLSSILSALLYDFVYQLQVGTSFLEKYYLVQISERTLKSQATNVFPIKLPVLFYYLSRALIYTLPWSICSLILSFKFAKSWGKIKQTVAQPWLLFLLCSSLTYIFCMSVFDRSASRYIFPVYYTLSAFFILYTIDILPVSLKERILSAFNLKRIPFISACVYFLIFIFHLLHFYLKGF